MEDISWGSMKKFMDENIKLITKFCRHYKQSPMDVQHIIEKAYCDAMSTYVIGRSTSSRKYPFVNHFMQYLKTGLRKESSWYKNVVFFDDMVKEGDQIDNFI